MSSLPQISRAANALSEPISLYWIEEPLIRFGHDQKVEDPRDGLTLFGPLDRPSRREVRIGVIGHAEGIRRYREWAEGIQHPIVPETQDVRRIAYPGFEAVFGATWDPEPVVAIEISESDLSSVFINDRQQRVYQTVNAYADRIIRSIQQGDGDVDVWFVVVPEDVYTYCRPQANVQRDRQVAAPIKIRRSDVAGVLSQNDLFSDRVAEREAARAELHDPDFRRQLKARLLDVQAVTQIVREGTLAPREVPGADRKSNEDHLKFEANAAWRLTTTAYYKSGGLPWKIADVREGVCYLGLTFRRLDDLLHRDDKTACCAAQMFLDSGDGVIFKGAVGPWYGGKQGHYHLSREAALDVVRMAVSAYADIKGAPPRELFVHGRVGFWDEEWEGFTAAAGEATQVVGVRIKNEPHFRLYRNDKYAVLRGLAYIIDDRTAYLWTKGYIPRLQTYPGLEVPRPLFVEVNRGTANIQTVLKDVMALTKLNYNTTNFADGEPVTLKFADRVGAILTAGPPGHRPPLLHFRHYI